MFDPTGQIFLSTK